MTTEATTPPEPTEAELFAETYATYVAMRRAQDALEQSQRAFTAARLALLAKTKSDDAYHAAVAYAHRAPAKKVGG